MTARHLFLSYCHRDDEPYGPKEKRWVEEFEKALTQSISQELGPGEVELWRDKRRLKGNEQFDDTIEQQLDRSDIFVAVLSKHYLKSDYCRKELQAFGTHFLDRGELHVANLSRIVKVFRREIPREAMVDFVKLPALAGAIDRNEGFKLFYRDSNGEDQDVLVDPEKTGLYWETAAAIAKSIEKLLAAAPAERSSNSRPAPLTATAPPTPPHHVVYVARTSTDLQDRRKALCDEFEGQGWRVLPDHQLPEDAPSFRQAVQADLESSELSVHLIGAHYAAIPEGTDQSIVTLQAEIALARGPALKTLLWSPAGQTSDAIADERQRRFVDTLVRSAADPPSVEFVRVPFDELKQLAVDRLNPPPPPPAAPAAPTTDAQAGAAPGPAGTRSAYLVCEPGDRSAVKALKEALESRGLRVDRSVHDGTPEQLDAAHRTRMCRCDVLVVYWGSGSAAWMDIKLSDADKAAGWEERGGRPFDARIVVVAAPDTEAKQDFDTPPGVTVVKGDDPQRRLQELLG